MRSRDPVLNVRIDKKSRYLTEFPLSRTFFDNRYVYRPKHFPGLT